MKKFNGITECTLCGGNVKIQRHDSNSNSYLNLDKEIIEKLKSQNKTMREFIKDCSVSHEETRYKYRAQVILNSMEGFVDGN